MAYYRRAIGDPVEARVTHQLYDAAGRLTQQRDPRLFALLQSGTSVPTNLSTFHDLSGQTLCSDSVDAGWQLDLSGAGGPACESWDQRGWHRRTEHDSLLRPVAIHEYCFEETERCAERIIWASSSPENALHNRCGQPVRHDDPAGSRWLPEYGLTGAVLAEDRRFLDSLEPPDWPVTEAERNSLLEPGDGSRSAWHFAATGEALSQTDVKGHVRHFAHDRAGQLREVRLQRSEQTTAETPVSGIEYNASGQVQQELTGNGMRTFSSYDPADGHLLSLANQDPGGVFLQNLSYRHDPAGNITQIADAALPIQYFANQRIEPVRHFAYDTLYQLIEASGWESAKPSLGPALPVWQPFGPLDASRWCNYSETYHYDEAGNLLQRVHQGAVDDTLNMQVAPHSNRSIKIRPGANLDELFDARGNLLELQPGQRLQWNGRSQLTQITQVSRADGNDDLERYVYDNEGQRLRKWRTAAAKSVTHAGEVRYLPGIELHTDSATGERLQVVSVQAGRCSVRLLHWDSPPPNGVDNDQLRYCFDDHLGSSAIEVDAQAKPISQEVYYPFGGTAWLAGQHEVETSYKTIRYSGKERDTTGLYYYGARYYAPWLQRWLNPDPAGEVDGLNFFRFVRNSPANFVDVQGHFPVLRKFFDYRLETRTGIRHLITQRGLKSFGKKSPEVSRLLNEGLKKAKDEVTRTLFELRENKHDTNSYDNFFGKQTEDGVVQLEDHYQSILSNIERIQKKPEKFVFFRDDEGKRSKASAFIYHEDRRHKVYINSTFIDSATVGDIAHVLVHEFSHQNVAGKATKDYWYLYSSFGDVADRTDDRSTWDDQNQTASRATAITLAGVYPNEIHPKIQHNFIEEAGGANIEEAARRFRADPSLRSRMALRNADNIAGFVFSDRRRTSQISDDGWPL
ncbi:hypothetical protein PS862_05334 [Pseudomonas fluorescens]|uniref:Lysine-specific metallo-endopeptidase domain-containing protein n=2 Tax=Pseudomonas fluorescens TaxID=294 RepID=A0A5E7PL87_PSEFL|nr:hypothetical protein PS862_05334 [Pseudomonas fluorescens]